MRRFGIVMVGLVIALLVIPAGAAFADAGSHASCMGLEASGISPKGSSEELPGGMPQLIGFIHETFPGTPAGAVVSSIAKIQAGSHEACDQVTG